MNEPTQKPDNYCPKCQAVRMMVQDLRDESLFYCGTCGQLLKGTPPPQIEYGDDEEDKWYDERHLVKLSALL